MHLAESKPLESWALHIPRFSMSWLIFSSLAHEKPQKVCSFASSVDEIPHCGCSNSNFGVKFSTWLLKLPIWLQWWTRAIFIHLSLSNHGFAWWKSHSTVIQSFSTRRWFSPSFTRKATPKWPPGTLLGPLKPLETDDDHDDDHDYPLVN